MTDPHFVWSKRVDGARKRTTKKENKNEREKSDKERKPKGKETAKQF